MPKAAPKTRGKNRESPGTENPLVERRSEIQPPLPSWGVESASTKGKSDTDSCVEQTSSLQLYNYIIIHGQWGIFSHIMTSFRSPS